MRIDEYDYKVNNNFGNHTEERKGGWLDGEVSTPWGYVICYAQGSEHEFHCSTLRFIHNGRCYVRNFHGKRYTTRGIKTKAMQFAKEIATTN